MAQCAEMLETKKLQDFIAKCLKTLDKSYKKNQKKGSYHLRKEIFD